jgi:hypothetical protein
MWEEAYLTLRCTMVQRVHTGALVLLGNLPKIHSRDLFSCMTASAAHLALTMGCAYSCSNGTARLRLNLAGESKLE